MNLYRLHTDRTQLLYDDIEITRTDFDTTNEIIKLARMFGKRIRGGEDLLLQYPSLLLSYVENAMGGKRWKRAEDVILNNKEENYRAYIVGYAAHIIKGRWKAGEEVIKNNARAAAWYAKEVIGGRWKEAEDVIKQDGRAAGVYAMNVLNERWPAAEEAIQNGNQDTNIWERYRRKFQEEIETEWLDSKR